MEAEAVGEEVVGVREEVRVGPLEGVEGPPHPNTRVLNTSTNTLPRYLVRI
jgi:hypothetical protein